MDQGPHTAPVASGAAEPRRRASILAAAIVVALALAVVKPWSLGQAGPGANGSAIPLRATPTGSPGIASVSPTTPAGDPNAMACLAGEAEQVLTVERSADREVRSWIAVPGLAATGPLDPRLVPLTIFSSHVVGLGVCAARPGTGASPVSEAPTAGSESGATLVDVRSITLVAGVATATDLGPPQLLPDALNGQDPALLYGPPSVGGPAATASATTQASRATGSPSPPASSGEAAWRAGWYAIAFRFASDDASVLRWLRIDLATGAGGGS